MRKIEVNQENIKNHRQTLQNSNNNYFSVASSDLLYSILLILKPANRICAEKLLTTLMLYVEMWNCRHIETKFQNVSISDNNKTWNIILPLTDRTVVIILYRSYSP